jgi:hypothetical protein
MPVSGKGPAPRELPYALLTDTADIEALTKAVAEALSNVATFRRGLLAARPLVAASKEGDIYLATDDTAWGPNGTPWLLYGGAWVEFPTPMITSAMLAAESVHESTLSSALLGPAANLFGLRKLGQSALEAAAGNDPRLMQAANTAIQPGVINATDFATATMSVTAGGKLEWRCNGAAQAWIKDPVTGGLVYTTTKEEIRTLTPPSLPVAGKYMSVGIDVSVASMAAYGGEAALTVTSGVEQASEALALENAAAGVANHVRVMDVIMLNTAGVYSVVKERSRKPWARGARASRRLVATFTPATGSLEEIAGLAIRIECSGLPVRITFHAYANATAASQGVATGGVGSELLALSPLGGWENTAASTGRGLCGYSAVVTPAAGSILFKPTAGLIGATAAVIQSPMTFTVEELSGNANNGTS